MARIFKVKSSAMVEDGINLCLCAYFLWGYINGIVLEDYLECKVNIIHMALELAIIPLYPSHKNKITLTMYVHSTPKTQMDYRSKTLKLRKSTGINLCDFCLGQAFRCDTKTHIIKEKNKSNFIKNIFWRNGMLWRLHLENTVSERIQTEKRHILYNPIYIKCLE